MIDRVEVVIKAWQRAFFRAQPAAVFQPPLDDQHIQPSFRHIGAEHKAMMPRAYDDAIVGFFQCSGHQ